MKDACGERYASNLVDQWTGLLSSELKVSLKTADMAALFRDVELCCADQPWVFVRTVIPDRHIVRSPLARRARGLLPGRDAGARSQASRAALMSIALAAGERSARARGALRNAELHPRASGRGARGSCLRGAHRCSLRKLSCRQRAVPRTPGVRLPRSGPELFEQIAQRWRWFSYRVRFHPWTTNELPKILGHDPGSTYSSPG